MKSKPFLSILIPVYNVEEEYLRACLDSVIKEKSQQLEIIIVDDASTNNSADICRKYLSGWKQTVE